MKVEQIDEINKVIEQANSGNWIPSAIVAGFLSLIIVLILIIYNKDKNSSVKRHEDAEKQISLLTSIVARLEVNDENKSREIKEVKSDIKDNTKRINEIR